MTRPEQKIEEKRQLAMVLKARPALLPDILAIESGNDGLDPDLIVMTGDGARIGIEMTALFDPFMEKGFTQHAIEAARKRICEEARRLYRQSGGPELRLNGSIGAGPYSVDRVAKYIVECIRRHDGDGTCISHWPSGGAPVELHLSFWPCSNADEVQEEWRLEAAGSSIVLTEEHLRSVIARKSHIAEKSGYSARFGRVWMMAVGACYPPSTSFVLPDAADTWRFDHAFDLVVVYCPDGDGFIAYP